MQSYWKLRNVLSHTNLSCLFQQKPFGLDQKYPPTVTRSPQNMKALSSPHPYRVEGVASEDPKHKAPSSFLKEEWPGHIITIVQNDHDLWSFW